ncbi:MAG: hypothetical protein ABR981_04150 [Candidatus Micrarchaeaceae archaeon]|jgi:hypothetical protein
MTSKAMVIVLSLAIIALAPISFVGLMLFKVATLYAAIGIFATVLIALSFIGLFFVSTKGSSAAADSD